VIKSLFSTAVFLFVATSAFADRVDLKDYPRDVTVYRYLAQDFGRLVEIPYDGRDEGFYPRNSRTVHFNACETALQRQQSFPLLVATEKLGYSAEDVSMLTQVGSELNYDQIVFLEAARQVPPEDFKEIKSLLMKSDVDTSIDQNEGKGFWWSRLKTAALWTIAGQTIDHQSPKLSVKKLPWEYESGTSPTAKQKFDRSKYKFVSEWGRAGQVAPGEIEPLFAMAAAMDYQRVRSMGGKVEDAWVMFSTGKPANIRYYETLFPGNRYLPDVTESERSDALFLVPLHVVMEKFPPHQQLLKLKAMIELSGGALTDQTAMDLLMNFHTLIEDEVNFNVPGVGDQGQPLVIDDMSMGGGYFKTRQKWYELYRIPKDRWEGMEKMWSTSVDGRGMKIENTGQYTDQNHSYFKWDLIPLHSMEISNLNAEIAKKDPDYAKKAIISSFYFYLKKWLGDPLPSPKNVQRYIEILRKSGRHLAVTTFNDEIARQLADLHPEKTLSKTIKLLDNTESSSVREMLSRNSNQDSHTVRSSVFSMAQVISLLEAEKDPSPYIDAVHTGSWRQNYLLNELNHF
jgi:hypothetical protein